MKRILLAAALAAFSVSIQAQMGPGPGGGPGPMGPRFNEETTPGWTMMTPEERKAHQDKMRSFRDHAQCQAYMEEHRKQMDARAQEKGKTLPGKGPGSGCGYLDKRNY